MRGEERDAEAGPEVEARRVGERHDVADGQHGLLLGGAALGRCHAASQIQTRWLSSVRVDALTDRVDDARAVLVGHGAGSTARRRRCPAATSSRSG